MTAAATAAATTGLGMAAEGLTPNTATHRGSKPFFQERHPSHRNNGVVLTNSFPEPIDLLMQTYVSHAEMMG